MLWRRLVRACVPILFAACGSSSGSALFSGKKDVPATDAGIRETGAVPPAAGGGGMPGGGAAGDESAGGATGGDGGATGTGGPVSSGGRRAQSGGTPGAGGRSTTGNGGTAPTAGGRTGAGGTAGAGTGGAASGGTAGSATGGAAGSASGGAAGSAGGSGGTSGAGNGGTGLGGNAAGGTPGTATPGVVACNGLPCAVGSALGSACCVSALPLASVCIPTLGAGCANGGTIVACDDAADCMNGQVCCATAGGSSGTPVAACEMMRCKDTARQLCRTDGECRGNGSCQRAPEMPDYSVCR